MRHDKSKRKSEWISASDVGRSEFCPNSVALKYAGAKPSRKAVAAQDRGNLKHEQFNRQISTDKRCYVASYLYGMEDQRTETLRQFRDNALQCSPGGRTLIAVYYRLSPMVIEISKKSSWVDLVLRRIVDRLVLRAEQRGKNHDS